jgi:uncharacterized protein (DUF1499 family)
MPGHGSAAPTQDRLTNTEAAPHGGDWPSHLQDRGLMNNLQKRIVIVLACIAMVIVGGLAVMSWMSRKPVTLGVTDGRLTECPDTPNCVSTQAADASHRMEPIALTGSAEEALQKLKELIAGMPRTRILVAEGNYLHAEFRSRLFGFVDDVEFLIDAEQQQIPFRSASRVGHSDLGANRKRMEAIRAAFDD